MTIHELLQAAGLTANDEIPIWDVNGTGEPTKKITAQQLALAVVSLANLVTGVKGNAESNYRNGNVNLTPANIGAVATNLAVVTDCDDNTLTGDGGQIHFYRVYGGGQLNTPYTQGLTSGSEFLLLVFGNADYTTQICYTLSDEQIFIRSKAGQGSAWSSRAWLPSVLGVKGNAESTYRTGNVNLTPANIGAAPAAYTQWGITVTGGTHLTLPTSGYTDMVVLINVLGYKFTIYIPSAIGWSGTHVLPFGAYDPDSGTTIGQARIENGDIYLTYVSFNNADHLSDTTLTAYCR